LTLVWKRGEDYVIFNPPRKSEQWDEWQKIKQKEKEKQDAKSGAEDRRQKKV